MDDLISIIIPVYKVELQLSKCIESIVKQSYQNLEIILVDDGSPDKCGDICDEWALKDNRIIVIHKDNGGVSSARNLGLKKATGKYIGFVDSDDYIKLDMFEKLYKMNKKYDAQLSVCNVFGVSGNDIEVYNRQSFIKLMFSKDGPQGFLCNKLYDKSIIDEYNLFLDENVHICEDLLFNVNYVNKIEKIVYLHEELYYYVENNLSATKNIFATKRWTTLLDAYIKMEYIFEEYDNEMYDLFLTELMWAAVRVRTEMQISKVKYDDVINKYNNIIKKKKNRFLFSRYISGKTKVKIVLYIYFYKIIAYLKTYKRKIWN